MASHRRISSILLRSFLKPYSFSPPLPDISSLPPPNLTVAQKVLSCLHQCLASAFKTNSSMNMPPFEVVSPPFHLPSSRSYQFSDEDPPYLTVATHRQQFATFGSQAEPEMLSSTSLDAYVDDEPEETTSSDTAPFVEPTDIYIPVKAFFISRRINLKSLQEQQHFLGTITSRNHLILKWKDRPPGCPPVTHKHDIKGISTWSPTRYIVVFNYGAVVLFNFGVDDEYECIDVIRKHCTEQCQEAKKDDFDIIIRPTLETWCQGGHDKVLLKKLNTDNIRIIASILGQSVALDHYGRKVDALVTIFSDLNQKMEKTGTFTMKRKALFRVVATANTTLADVILRLGLLERSDAAWKDANYAALWEFLREEYELEQRFESFDFKLEIIQHNVRFFLEVLQNRKSDTLEWIIIFLIAGEICVSMYEILHGSGVM